MPLSWLVKVSNFCSILLSPFLLIVWFLSSQAISFQIFFYTLFPWFPWSAFLPFPVISTSVTSCIWELMAPCMAWSYHCRQLWNISSIFTTTPTLSWKTSVGTLSTDSWHPVNQSLPTYYPDYTTLHPTQHRLIHNSNFPLFTKIQQNWSNTTLINPLNSLNFCQALPILALTTSDAPPQQLIISCR